MKNKYIIILIGMVVSQAVLAQAPHWFGQDMPGYSTSNYYIGEGEGASYSEAINNAQAVVASQIRVSIESQVNSYISEVSDDDRVEIKESFESEINSTVDETIQGITMIKNERIKKRYYVTVALDKRKYLAGLRVEINQLWSKIYNLIKDARELVNDGKIFTALENYTDAQPYVSPFYVKKSFYDALADRPYTIDEFITVEGIISEVRKLINGIDLDVTAGNKQTGTLGALLQKAIIVESVYKKRDINIPNLALKVEYDDGTLERLETDDNGMAEIWTTANCENGKKGNIKIRLDLFKLPKLYKKYFMNVSTTAKFNCTNDVTVSFSLFVEDENKNRLNKVEQKIAKSLEKIGYTVTDDAELGLNGFVSIIEENEVQGKSGPMVQIKAELSVLLVTKSTEETVGSFTQNFVGLGKNKKKAQEKAYNKMKIKKKALSEALSDSEEILQKVLTKKSDEYINEAKALYDQTKISKAIGVLAKVSFGESQISESRELIKKYKKERDEYWAAKRKREEEAKEKERQKELELAKIEAEKAMAIAESEAREKEAEARIAEAKAAMEKAKADIAKIEKEKLQAEASIAESEADAERARADAIAAASNKGQNVTKNSSPLNSNEKKLENTWKYIGAMELSTSLYYFEGSGRLLSFNDDRSFKEGSSTGYWIANADKIKVNGFAVPYVIENGTLILGFEISGDTYLMVYELL